MCVPCRYTGCLVICLVRLFRLSIIWVLHPHAGMNTSGKNKNGKRPIEGCAAPPTRRQQRDKPSSGEDSDEQASSGTAKVYLSCCLVILSGVTWLVWLLCGLALLSCLLACLATFPVFVCLCLSLSVFVCLGRSCVSCLVLSRHDPSCLAGLPCLSCPSCPSCLPQTASVFSPCKKPKVPFHARKQHHTPP
jgi:hypothetical protein